MNTANFEKVIRSEKKLPEIPVRNLAQKHGFFNQMGGVISFKVEK